MLELFEDTLRYLSAYWPRVLIACALSVFANWILIQILVRVIPGRRDHEDLTQVQAAHTLPTPRIGGICVAILFTLFFFLVPAASRLNFLYVFLCMMPVLATGIAEDLGYRITPLQRLFATFVSAVLAVALVKVWVFRTGLPYVDHVWEFAIVGIIGTVILVAALVHAINIIDGANGLVAIFSILACIVLAEIADGLGAPTMTRIMRFLAVILFGFLVFNWPRPRIFLGDTGPYLLGFIFSWSCILFLNRFQNVSIFALGLVFLWPIAETMLAVWRRAMRRKSIVSPDFMHTHQVVMRGLQVCLFGGRSHWLANSLTVVILLPFMLAPMLAGLSSYRNTQLSFALLLAFLCLYFASYTFLIYGFRRVRRWRRKAIA